MEKGTDLNEDSEVGASRFREQLEERNRFHRKRSVKIERSPGAQFASREEDRGSQPTTLALSGDFDMTPQQRAACATLRRILGRFIALDPNFRAAHIESLMGIALQPGVSITGLAKETGQSLPSTSRHVGGMTPPTDHHPERLGLIYVDFGRDSRTKPLRLTALGEDLVLTVTDEILTTWRPTGEDR